MRGLAKGLRAGIATEPAGFALGGGRSCAYENVDLVSDTRLPAPNLHAKAGDVSKVKVDEI